MKTVQNTLKLAGVSAIALGAVFGASPAFSETVFEIAFNQPETHPQYKAMERFGEALAERTNGEYTVKIFPNELLGAQKETVEMAQTGTIAMSLAAASLLESWNPDFVVFNLPYVFDSMEHQKSVVNNPEIVGDLYNSVADQGIVVVAAFTAGSRNVYLKDRPVETPADLSGEKIRVMQSQTNIDMMNMMGGNGIAMGQGEVYTAIQTGVLDGGENNEVTYWSLKHSEIAPYFSYTQHLMIPDYLVMNVDMYEDLPDDVKQIFTEELQKAADYEFDVFAEDAAKSRALAEEAGATFNEVDLQPFRDAVRPLTEQKLTSDVTKKIYAQMHGEAQ
ncbi:TRAP transporter substrate-binding protein [Martelella endophytica]|uniref:C4-dicarboxylate ABC transporter substrate-binding protein n=1 Tax=Martelella endophytica TaxID=1486262 RepID=A0A0D5LMU2_MAREN|nr:TRAP transporter substrate-binding protein [Martelella endophytica]AJY45524.1 C4-dicarboxylate ABC transporter substrate-binding protein [Martelella endophytica]